MRLQTPRERCSDVTVDEQDMYDSDDEVGERLRRLQPRALRGRAGAGELPGVPERQGAEPNGGRQRRVVGVVVLVGGGVAAELRGLRARAIHRRGGFH